MKWKYIEKDEIPKPGDHILFMPKGFDLRIGSCNCHRESVISDNIVYEISEIFKWINIDEIKNNTDCDEDGNEIDYIKSPCEFYVTGIKFDKDKSGYKFSLMPCMDEIEVENLSKDTEDALFDAAKARSRFTCEIKQGHFWNSIRNVKLCRGNNDSD